MPDASPITRHYLERTQLSRARTEEAKRVLPGGDTRSTAWFAPYPPLAAEGSGAYFTDVDGNRYVELLNNYTSLIHGHAHPAVVEAIAEQLRHGACFAAPHESAVSLARILCERVPSAERVRFTNSGTEAVMLALRVARAFTGRPLLAKAEGGYHGTWDDVQLSVAPPLEQAGPAERPTAVAGSPGLSPGAAASTVVIPYNDLDSARAILEPLRERLAAVVVEPVQGAGGVVPAEQAYLDGLRELTEELGALLVLDEVISFRLAQGGAQSLYGVTPDLTIFGKIVGGGLPVGAFGGREDVMRHFDPSRPGAVPHYGTFNGNPATMAAGIATLELLTETELERLNNLGNSLRNGIAALAAELGLAIFASGVGSLVNIHLTAAPVRSYRDVARADRESAALLHLALLNEGIFVARRGLMSVSTPMDEQLIDDVLAAIRRAVLAVQAERAIPELSHAVLDA